MSEPELVLDSASVKVWLQSGRPGASEFWVNFNGLRDFHITMSEFIRRRDASALHVVSKQDHWYRGRDMAEVVRFVNARTAAAGGGRVIVLGNSMGGFGALLHSSALRCDLVVAAGPQVIVDDDLSIGHDDRYRPEWQALETPEWLPWHDATRHCTRDVPIRLLYDPHAAEDRWHAAALRALPNVSLWRAPFGGHEVLLELRRAGLWVRALEAALDGDHAAWTALMPAFRAHRDQRFPYHLPMGMRHYRSGRLEHAARHFKRATEVHPGAIESHAFLAHALRDSGSLPGAIAALEGAIPNLDGDSRYWWIFQAIANVHLEAGDIDAALAAVLRGKAIFPERAEIDAEHAKILMLAAETPAAFSAAERLAARAAARDPANLDLARLLVRIHAQRARHLAQRGRTRAVVAALDSAVAQQPTGTLAAAIRLIYQARAADPEDLSLIIELGHAHEAIGDSAGAVALLRTAADDPALGAEGWEILHRLTALHAAAGDLAAAEAALIEAARRFPDVPATHLELGKFRIERPRSNAAAAARSLRRALAIDPGNAAARALLDRADQIRARRLAAHGRADLAAPIYQRLADAAPNEAARRIDLADALEAAGTPRAAAAVWRAASALVAQDEDGWWPYHHLAALWARNGDLAAAEAALAEAAERFPDRAEAVAELGKFKFEKHLPDFPEAMRLLHRAVDLAPEDERLRALLRRCREFAGRAATPERFIDRVRSRLRIGAMPAAGGTAAK